MLDRRLRPHVEAALAPLAARCGGIRPATLTLLGGGLGLVAAVAAAVGPPPFAVVLWLANRVVDGVDGAVARMTARTSDTGGYLDMVVDVVVYAAVPIGVAVGQGDTATWVAAAVLLASFYVNTITWAYLSALLEKRGRGASSSGETTSVTMPPGLVEGTETIVAYTLLLAWPAAAVPIMAVMAVLTFVGAALRMRRGLVLLAVK